MTVRGTVEELPKLVYHIPLAMVASMIVATLLSMFLLRDSVPFGPSVWLAGFGLGFLINRKLRDRAACWVGIIGVLGLAILIICSYRGFETSAYYRQQTGDSYWAYLDESLFTSDSNKCGSSECLGQFFFTAPVVASVAYSLGAFLALRSKSKGNIQNANATG